MEWKVSRKVMILYDVCVKKAGLASTPIVLAELI